MNAFVVRGLYVNFYFDSSKVSVFADAHGVWVEDTIDVSLYFIEISCSYYCPVVLYISQGLLLLILIILNSNFVINPLILVVTKRSHILK